jgi:hypothetical protein
MFLGLGYAHRHSPDHGPGQSFELHLQVSPSQANAATATTQLALHRCEVGHGPLIAESIRNSACGIAPTFPRCPLATRALLAHCARLGDDRRQAS